MSTTWLFSRSKPHSPCYVPAKPTDFKTPGSRDLMWGGACSDRLGRLSLHWDCTESWPRREVLPEFRGIGLRLSSLGNHCGGYTALMRWLCIYPDGCGRKVALASLLVPGDESLWMLPFTDVLQEDVIILTLCSPGFPQITTSAPRLFVCLFSRRRAVPSCPYTSQTWWPLKFHSSSAIGCKFFFKNWLFKFF